MTLNRQKNKAIPIVESLDDRIVLSAVPTIGVPMSAAVELARATPDIALLIHQFDPKLDRHNGPLHGLNAGRVELYNAIRSVRSRIASNRPSPILPTRAAQSRALPSIPSAGTTPGTFGTTTFSQLPTGFTGNGISPDTSVVTGSTGAGVYSGLDLFGISTGFETGIAMTDDGL